MICDEFPNIRRIGWKRINKSRLNVAHIGHKQGVRVFELPKIIFDSSSNHGSIEWPTWQFGSVDDELHNALPFSPPPLLRRLTDTEVEAWANKALPEKYSLPDIPCHSQAVERHVKLVTEASTMIQIYNHARWPHRSNQVFRCRNS